MLYTALIPCLDMLHHGTDNECCGQECYVLAQLCKGASRKADTDVHVQLWDLRAKRSAHTMSEDYQILSVAFGEAGDQIYTGGIENVIKVWDLRKIEVSMTLKGHTDTITGLRVSPDGNLLLSNAMVSPLNGITLALIGGYGSVVHKASHTWCRRCLAALYLLSNAFQGVLKCRHGPR